MAFRFLDRPRRHQPALIGALLALSFATKETTFITGFVAFTFFVLVLISPWRRRRDRRRCAPSAWRPGAGRWPPSSASSRSSSRPSSPTPTGVGRALHRARLLARPARGRPRRRAVELLPRGAVRRRVAGAAARRGRRRGRAAPPDAAAAVPDLGLRAVADHLLVGGREVRLARAAPAAAAAAAGRASACRRSGARAGRWYGALGAVAVGRRLRLRRLRLVPVNAVHRADPRELLVSTQSSEEVERVADEVVAAEAPSAGQPTSITVDSSEGATFPWAWYFRDLPAGYVELGAGSTRRPPDSDVLILTQAAHDRLGPQLPGTRRASSRSASGGCATTTRCRRRAGGAGSPTASRGTRRAACPSGSTQRR